MAPPPHRSTTSPTVLAPAATVGAGRWTAGRTASVFLLIAAVTFVVFWPSLSNGFVSLDDDENFLANPHYRGLRAENLRWMWTTFHLGTWIPLSWMSLGLDFVLWGMNPVGYHAVNMVWHALDAGLVYLLALRLLSRPMDSMRATIARTTPWALHLSATFAALVFSLHPLRVESVTWITERRDVLSGFFYLSTVLCFVRFAEQGERATRWYIASLATYALALLSKGTAVTIPGVLLLLWVYPFGQLGGATGWGRAALWRATRVLAPFVVLALAFTIVVFVALQNLEQLPIGGKLAVSSASWCFYVFKTLWPTGLSPLYAMPDVVNPLAARYIGSYVVILVVAVAAWMARRRLPGAVMALVMFTAIVFPLLGLHQGGPQIVADRNSFNASAALAMLAGGTLVLALHRSRVVAVAGAMAIVVTFGVLTWRQTQVWRDSEALWTRVLEIEPDSPYGHNDYGNVLFQQGRLADATAHFERAVQLRPQFGHAWANLGVALAASGRDDQAIAAYQRALAIDPQGDEVESNYGVALMRRGDPSGAIAHFARAIALNANNADAHVNWGNALVRLGRAAEAVDHYATAVTIRPDHADAQLNWGVALATQGQLEEAIAHFRRALEINPSMSQAQEYLARAEATRRDETPQNRR